MLMVAAKVSTTTRQSWPRLWNSR